MLNPALRRLLLVCLSLAGAALACARADIPLAPGIGQLSTPLPAPPTNTPTPRPEVSATPAPQPVDLTPYPGPAITETQPPALPTDTAPPATETATPAPVVIPANAAFTQAFSVSFEGGPPVGRPQDIGDGDSITWASLRDSDGIAAWIFDLGSPQNVVGLLLFAHRDGNEDTTLQTIEVSNDGTSWEPVYVATGDCGELACDALLQDEYVDVPVGPVQARYIRLRGGPTRFAFAEVQVATLP